VWLGGYSRPFAGRLDGENRLTVTYADFNYRNSGAKTLTLQLRMDGTQPVIDAAVTDSQKNILARLTRPNARSARFRAGAYTFALPSNAAWKNQPARIDSRNGNLVNPIATALGDGYGILRLSQKGSAIASGKLPDGTPFSSAHFLDGSGQLLFFLPLYVHRNTWPPPVSGWLRGSLSFMGSAESGELSGSLRWVLPHVFFYTGEFLSAPVPFVGARYIAPANLQAELGHSPRFVVDGDGGFPPFSAGTSLNADFLLGTAPFRLSGNFSRATGLLGGHFSPPGSLRWISYNGVLLQNQNRVFGQFRPVSRRGTAGITVTP
jgi:hypothetical protein